MTETKSTATKALKLSANEIFYRSPYYAEIVPEERSEEILNVMRDQCVACSPGSGEWDRGVRTGRGTVARYSLNNVERTFVMRTFRRGGMTARFFERTFFHFPFGRKYRPLEECMVLEELFKAHISVPRVVAGYVRTSFWGFCYGGVIATEEIAGSRNLLECLKDGSLGESAFEVICAEVAVFAKAILNLGFYPPDLHLGNVLLRGEREVFLIDFDKTTRFSQASYVRYREKVMTRWERSCKKHRVSDAGVGAFREQLFA